VKTGDTSCLGQHHTVKTGDTYWLGQHHTVKTNNIWEQYHVQFKIYDQDNNFRLTNGKKLIFTPPLIYYQGLQIVSTQLKKCCILIDITMCRPAALKKNYSHQRFSIYMNKFILLI
jgi:hypothetical protein